MTVAQAGTGQMLWWVAVLPGFYVKVESPGISWWTGVGGRFRVSRTNSKLLP